MPPHTLYSSARLLYAFTALVAVSIIATVGFAGAGQEEAQCKGNSPKKICPDVLPADGATVSGTVKVSAQVEDAVSSISFEVDNVAIAPPERVAPYEVMWDTTKSSNGAHVLEVTTTDTAGKNSVLEHRVNVSNPTAPPPPPPGDTTAPTVGLTNPAAGATVSGAVSVAASASDTWPSSVCSSRWTARTSARRTPRRRTRSAGPRPPWRTAAIRSPPSRGTRQAIARTPSAA